MITKLRTYSEHVTIANYEQSILVSSASNSVRPYNSGEIQNCPIKFLDAQWEKLKAEAHNVWHNSHVVMRLEPFPIHCWKPSVTNFTNLQPHYNHTLCSLNSLDISCNSLHTGTSDVKSFICSLTKCSLYLNFQANSWCKRAWRQRGWERVNESLFDIPPPEYDISFCFPYCLMSPLLPANFIQSFFRGFFFFFCILCFWRENSNNFLCKT